TAIDAFYSNNYKNIQSQPSAPAPENKEKKPTFITTNTKPAPKAYSGSQFATLSDVLSGGRNKDNDKVNKYFAGDSQQTIGKADQDHNNQSVPEGFLSSVKK
ncbi:MAG: hypothetical protein MHPSP_004270, partial [Paramarteilia canceri]